MRVRPDSSRPLCRVLNSDLVAHATDDGFREIQLNGKQLVFLFMAATVVSIVIFLCGVLVGRGVRTERAAAAEAAAVESPTTDLSPSVQAPAASPAPADSDPTKAAPPPEVSELSYFRRLEQPKEPVEILKPASPREVPAAATPRPDPPARSPSRRAEGPPSPPASSSAVPVVPPSAAPGPGFTVQVAALNVRGEADAIAKRLADKGYAAYVLAPSGGTPNVYRVRVGTFKTRREAESIAAKLQKEERFKPWITR